MQKTPTMAAAVAAATGVSPTRHKVTGAARCARRRMTPPTKSETKIVNKDSKSLCLREKLLLNSCQLEGLRNRQMPRPLHVG